MSGPVVRGGRNAGAVAAGTPPCPLCLPPAPAGAVGVRVGTDEGELVALTTDWRVVLVADPDYPGFARVILNRHVREMSELPQALQQALMAAVFAVERAQRAALSPGKINLASLGNVVPHLHWHIIPRAPDDAHFPQPIWGTRQRDPDPVRLQRWRAALPALREAIVAELLAVELLQP